MPDANYILEGLRAIAAEWAVLAVLWHVMFAALAAGLAAGWRPERRDLGLYLVLPLVSVGFVAWLNWNPFNGTAIAVIGLALLVASMLLGRERVAIAPVWMTIPGVLLLAFGWAYPHFLDTGSWWPYLYRAPTGLIPCPTLAAVTGASLICGAFGSRAWAWILGLGGAFYGVFGALYLEVTIDWVLAAGAVFLILAAHLAAAPGEEATSRAESPVGMER